MDESRVNDLQLQLEKTFLLIRSREKKLRFFRILCYGGTVLFFIGMVVFFVLVQNNATNTYEGTNNRTILTFVIPLFVLINVGVGGSSYYHSKFILTEQKALEKIIKELFPSAAYEAENKYLSMSSLIQSGLFGTTDRDKITGQSFGTLRWKEGSTSLVLNDIGVSNSKVIYWLSKTAVGAFFILIYYMFQGMFAKRIENISMVFRGVFSSVPLGKNINGVVLILPDYIEKHLDYLAENIQKIKNRDGLNLVKMEDVTFEKHFSVYASDDILARYILTPARMQQIVALRQKYDRQLMLSYSFNRFYFAVSMPEGFLGLDQDKISKGNSLHNFYHNVCMARDMIFTLNV